MRPRRNPTAAARRAACCALLALPALLAGCGGSSGNGLASAPPEKVLAEARKAAAGAASVHVTGSIISAGKPISLDMELVARKGAKGRVALEGVTIDLIATESAFYLSGNGRFYSRVAGAAAAAQLRGKWLKAPAGSGDFSSLGELTDLGELVDSSLASHGELENRGTVTVDGRSAIALADRSKGGTLYLAATGAPYPLRISRAGASPITITFDRWNQPVAIAAPAKAINITQLQNGP